jgi:hypothetical protein
MFIMEIINKEALIASILEEKVWGEMAAHCCGSDHCCATQD